MKYTVLSAVTCLILASSCTGCHSLSDKYLNFSFKKKRIPTISFVKITKFATVKKCVPISGSKCREGTTWAATGSGVIIAQNKDKGSLILTAAHVCNVHEEINKKTLMIEKLEGSLKLTTITNEDFNAEVVHKKLHEGIDLCLLYAPTLRQFSAINIAVKSPKTGDMSFNIAAPHGIFHPPAVPILSGYYSGYMTDTGSAMYTIPAMGGSSGSLILNEDFELIGIVYAASTVYTHMTLSTTHENIVDFIKEALETYAKN